jgi:hypothetical protein
VNVPAARGGCSQLGGGGRSTGRYALLGRRGDLSTRNLASACVPACFNVRALCSVLCIAGLKFPSYYSRYGVVFRSISGLNIFRVKPV